MVTRVIRGYRTISCEVASALALASMFDWREDVRATYYRTLLPETRYRRLEFRRAIMAVWRDRLERPNGWTIEALHPVVGEWVERQHGPAGAGAFGTQVFRKVSVPNCQKRGLQGRVLACDINYIFRIHSIPVRPHLALE